MALLVQNMERLNEDVKEEGDGVHNTLGIIENLTELKPDICVSAGEQGLVAWLLKRLRVCYEITGLPFFHVYLIDDLEVST